MPTLHIIDQLARIVYMCLDCKLMLDIHTAKDIPAIIVNPYMQRVPVRTKHNISGIHKINFIPKVFLERLLVRNNVKEIYTLICADCNDTSIESLLEKAYFAMICGIWYSEFSDGKSPNAFAKIDFFIREVQRLIHRYLTQRFALYSEFNNPAMVFRNIEDEIITPLFTKGTFGDTTKPYYEPATLTIYDFWVQQLTVMQHSCADNMLGIEIVDTAIADQIERIKAIAVPRAEQSLELYGE